MATAANLLCRKLLLYLMHWNVVLSFPLPPLTGARKMDKKERKTFDNINFRVKKAAIWTFSFLYHLIRKEIR